MGRPQGDPAAPLSLVRVQHPETMDMVAMRDYQRLPTLADIPEASIQQNARLSPGQSRIPRLRARRGNVERSEMPDMSVVTADFSAPRPQPPASSQATVVVPPVTAGPASPTPVGGAALCDLFNNPPSPDGVWATNASNFASGSHPEIRFVTDMPISEPRLNGDKGKGVDKRHHTEPVTSCKECACVECDAQKKGLLSSEMIYAYLAMRGAHSGGGLFEDLMAKYRENGGDQMIPSCPHALSKMNKELEEAASKREGKRPAVNVPSLVRPDGGLSEACPSTAGPDPSVVATLNTTPSLAGLVNVSPPNSVDTFSTNFNLDDVSDDGDVAKCAITPNDFLRMASGVSTAETDKPLPPLPLNSGETPREKLENENGSGNRNGVEIESENDTVFRDRVIEPGYRNQVCEETMDALTGSYTVTTNPSVLNEPPGVRHLDRLRGAFGSLFSRMQPRLGEHLDRIRLGLPQGSDSSLSVFSNSQYTDAELEAALASPSATAINGIPPSRVLVSLAEAEHTVAHIEELEAAAHRRAVDACQRLELLRNTLGRVTAGANYIADCRSSSRRAKIRRSVGHRLRGLEYRRARALDGLRAEEARHARDIEAIRVAEESVERIVGTVNLSSVEEVLGEASRLWDEAHGPEESE